MIMEYRLCVIKSKRGLREEGGEKEKGMGMRMEKKVGKVEKYV